MKLRDRLLLMVLLLSTTGSALAQTRGGAVTIRFGVISPFIALAGILILIMPAGRKQKLRKFGQL